MATADDLQAIQRTLNTAESAAQVRMAVGAALRAAGDAYPLLDMIPEGNAGTRTSLRGQLDSARLAVDRFYKSIVPTGSESYRNTWVTKGMPLVVRLYVVVAGIEGASGYKPRTSNWEILFNAIADAPKVFTEAVGNVAGQVAGAAGKAAGGLTSGLFSGLGISGTVSVALVVAVVAVVMTKGSIIGRIGALARKGG